MGIDWACYLHVRFAWETRLAVEPAATRILSEHKFGGVDGGAATGLLGKAEVKVV
ncbi:MAG: hypothetical protein H6658_18665 [Ardenticatenaceae bacterium]|nr:hypothetical protein [Ardenticatenaceae bacterium]